MISEFPFERGTSLVHTPTRWGLETHSAWCAGAGTYNPTSFIRPPLLQIYQKSMRGDEESASEDINFQETHQCQAGLEEGRGQRWGDGYVPEI